MLHDTSVSAKDLMTTRLRTVKGRDRVFDSTKMLLKYGISGAPVVDDHYRLIGMLSEKDCIQAFVNAIHHGLPPSFVEDVMSKDVVSVGPGTGILQVAHLFLRKRLRRIPVVDADGVLLGQVSRRDLLKRAVSIFEGAKTREAALLYLSALERSPPV